MLCRHLRGAVAAAVADDLNPVAAHRLYLRGPMVDQRDVDAGQGQIRSDTAADGADPQHRDREVAAGAGRIRRGGSAHHVLCCEADGASAIRTANFCSVWTPGGASPCETPMVQDTSET